MDAKGLTYSIDGQDRLVAASGEWNAFAQENCAPELAFERIIYASIWDFIYDTETRRIYRLMLEKVRASSSIRFPFRCDGPDRRRFMEMEILPLDAMGVRFNTSIIREEKREPVRLLDAFEARGEKLVMLCSWCKCVILEDGNCIEAEEAIRRSELFSEAKLPQITHGACAACSKRWLDGISSRR